MKILNEPIKVMAIFNNDGKIMPIKFRMDDQVVKIQKVLKIYEEKVIGNVEIRETFKVSRIGTIAGCMVTNGQVKRNCGVRLIRDGVVIYEGKLSSLKRFKDDVKEVNQGYECGLTIENYNDIKIGDVVECYIMEEKDIK